jgi:hypothetical protein
MWRLEGEMHASQNKIDIRGKKKLEAKIRNGQSPFAYAAMG